MSWQDRFTTYTTGVAFSLQLSHDQADLLAYLREGKYQGWKSRTGRDAFIPVFRALERRGLAEHNPAAVIVGMQTPGVKLKWTYRLTPAGHLALQMLQMAGVVCAASSDEVEAA